MDNLKEIYELAFKWYDKFFDYDMTYKELFCEDMADELTDLGFKIEFEHEYEYEIFEKYEDTIYDYKSLDRVIEDINDLYRIGSLIATYWKYFSDFSDRMEEILDSNRRPWFILALSRLILLSGENFLSFEGTLKEIVIISNKKSPELLKSGCCDSEQHLTVKDTGDVCLKAQGFKESFPKINSFRIKDESVKKLFDSVSGFFQEYYTMPFDARKGEWILEMANADGRKYRFRV